MKMLRGDMHCQTFQAAAFDHYPYRVVVEYGSDEIVRYEGCFEQYPSFVYLVNRFKTSYRWAGTSWYLSRPYIWFIKSVYRPGTAGRTGSTISQTFDFRFRSPEEAVLFRLNVV